MLTRNYTPCLNSEKLKSCEIIKANLSTLLRFKAPESVDVEPNALPFLLISSEILEAHKKHLKELVYEEVFKISKKGTVFSLKAFFSAELKTTSRNIVFLLEVNKSESPFLRKTMSGLQDILKGLDETSPKRKRSYSSTSSSSSSSSESDSSSNSSR